MGPECFLSHKRPRKVFRAWELFKMLCSLGSNFYLQWLTACLKLAAYLHKKQKQPLDSLVTWGHLMGCMLVTSELKRRSENWEFSIFYPLFGSCLPSVFISRKPVPYNWAMQLSYFSLTDLSPLLKSGFSEAKGHLVLKFCSHSPCHTRCCRILHCCSSPVCIALPHPWAHVSRSAWNVLTVLHRCQC